MKGNNHSIECGFRKVEISNETIELQPPPNLAGASDRGRRHHQNEDAIARDRVAKIGWLGDSCAYWLSPEKSLQLTQNDSWMRDAIESGIHTPSEAEASPSAHAIVRWLGADTTDDGKPNLTTFTIPSQGSTAVYRWLMELRPRSTALPTVKNQELRAHN